MARLGELERAVMDVLWNTPEPVAATRIVEELPREHAPAVTTILTVLDRLGAKGFVTRERFGRAYRYSATTSRAELIATTMLEALGSTSDRRSALVHFAGSVSDEEKALLRELLGEPEPAGDGAAPHAATA
ncbi:MAG TPA: BlaI/MecI/CopY family transcriptional regulator [Actinocrinis sp.]|nr:BlaI/MecI/CopY family transcriptional regulator [Actinocrinis sp.]